MGLLKPLRYFRSNDVIDVLADLFIEHGPPQNIRSGNGPKFVADAVREWLGRLGVTTLYVEPEDDQSTNYAAGPIIAAVHRSKDVGFAKRRQPL